MLYILNSYLVGFLLKFFAATHLAGWLAGFGVFAISQKKSKEKPGVIYRLYKLLLLPVFLALVALIAIPTITKIGFDVMVFPSISDMSVFLTSAIFSVFICFMGLRNGVHAVEKIKSKFTKSSKLERNRKTDVRDMDDFLPVEKKRFDPLKHIDLSQGIFVGLDETENPIFIPKGFWDTSHTLLSGRTRCGKGVALQILGVQSVMLGELLVVLDPKCDDWMPHIFMEACERHGKPYHFLDLRQSAGPQINLFEGCDAETLENMLIGAFSLTEKGDNADFYRLGDRKAARQAAAWIARHPGATPRQVLAEFGEQWAESAAGFSAALSEMAELQAVNRTAPGGIDLDELAREGGCLYVVGDMLNSRIIRMQRMILMRLMLLAKNRSIFEERRIIRVVADEFRVHISRPFITSLGASAGWKLLSILAFQSFQDLKDCPADLDGELVSGATLEGCSIQLSYRIKDPITADMLAGQTGEIQVDDETRTVDKNLALAETVDGRRTIRQATRFLVDRNMIMNLPVPNPDIKTIGCGVLVGASPLAQFCFTSPIDVERSQAAITPTVQAQHVDEDAPASVAAEALDVPDTADAKSGHALDVADATPEADPDPFGL